MSSLASAAAGGRFELPVCEDCGTVQYPVREVCASCLSDRLRWRSVEVGGTLLARTLLHRSMATRFAPRLPLEVGSVKLDAGPVAIALLEPGCEAGMRVRMRLQPGAAGKTLMVAAPEGAADASPG